MELQDWRLESFGKTMVAWQSSCTKVSSNGNKRSNTISCTDYKTPPLLTKRLLPPVAYSDNNMCYFESFNQ